MITNFCKENTHEYQKELNKFLNQQDVFLKRVTLERCETAEKCIAVICKRLGVEKPPSGDLSDIIRLLHSQNPSTKVFFFIFDEIGKLSQRQEELNSFRGWMKEVWESINSMGLSIPSLSVYFYMCGNCLLYTSPSPRD
eukprot:TRINITY_DN2749_c0_g1_i1.p1 TRINITY_DN2749_c0_g1~~TRINITY_DN2749_c0_g1_i1.p1  ORF type:complete len:139 (-),score=26.52 TRINITY_DN2749_c0_g1_i1:11-427(-)